MYFGPKVGIISILGASGYLWEGSIDEAMHVLDHQHVGHLQRQEISDICRTYNDLLNAGFHERGRESSRHRQALDMW